MKEIRISSDLWLLVGRELFEKGYITEDVLVWGAIEEPKMKWLLLEKEEYEKFMSMRDLHNPNPIEHSDKTEQELAEVEMAFNIFVRETIKNFPETENFFRRAGWKDFDNVIVMHTERTETIFRKVSL